MRAALLVLLLLVVAGPSAARQDDPRLDPLFVRLKAAANAFEAAPVEAEIWSIWSETSDPQSAGLLSRAVEAMGRRDHPAALEALNELVRREPTFAEAWNKRATLYYIIGDYRASVADIQRTLALEPRHFGALSGLGLIYLAINEPAAAVRSFEAALAIHPYMTGARANVERLKDELRGAPL